jgi:hypothetical protein
LTVRRTPPQPPLPDLSPERAYPILLKQLESLKKLNRKNYEAARQEEQEWIQFTEKIIDRTFGSNSPNRSHFGSAKSAGDHRISVRPWGSGPPVVDHRRHQNNFEARLRAFEAVLNSSLAELKVDLPEPQIQEVFEPGQEYEFYRAVTTILGFATTEIFVVDPYVSTELFDVYAEAIPRTVSFRLLTTTVQAPVESLARKYASGGNLQLRGSDRIHDRVLFADNRVWLCGQSLKDAARKKPTYIVEHDEPLMRQMYEKLWTDGRQII